MFLSFGTNETKKLIFVVMLYHLVMATGMI